MVTIDRGLIGHCMHIVRRLYNTVGASNNTGKEQDVARLQVAMIQVAMLQVAMLQVARLQVAII